MNNPTSLKDEHFHLTLITGVISALAVAYFFLYSQDGSAQTTNTPSQQIIAEDSFDAKTWKGGTGWNGPWYHEGKSAITSDKEASAPFHVRLKAKNGWIDRSVDLQGYDNAILRFNARVRSFEKNDWAEIMVKPKGGKWTAIKRFTPADSDNTYHMYEFDLTPYGLTDNFQIGVEGEMSGNRDYLYLDDIEISYQVETNDNVPPTRSNAAPLGVLKAGTTLATISLNTDEPATCKYGKGTNLDYNQLPNTLSTTGGTYHISSIGGLKDGESYNFEVRCKDALNNKNTEDYFISFSIAESPTVNHQLKTTVAGSGEGIINAAGINCGNDCSETYQKNTSVTLNATALNNSVFTGWNGDCSGQGTSCSLTMTKDMNITANFVSSTAPTTNEAVFGVTIDAVNNVSSIKDSLASLATRPTARIVFDEFVEPSYYESPVAELHEVADIMGEILDSFYVKQYSVAEYRKRAQDYVNAMSDVVDIWEIGNEINGEWLGSNVPEKMIAAYDVVEAAGEPTALTLYYNGSYDNGKASANNCWSKPQNQMQEWAKNNIPQNMKNGLDYVWVSYYEDDCENIQPDWGPIFEELHQMFPNAKLGMGEVGSNKSKARKEEILNKYYSMDKIHPQFVGGYFWWYYKQDMVPKTKDLWSTLNEYAKSWDSQN